MLELNDPRWPTLIGGRQTPIDPRWLLQKIASGQDTSATWKQLWDELYHQEKVGDSSYACVPHIVRIYREASQIDWNPYAIVAAIEFVRTEYGNPEIPEWLKESYRKAIEDLAVLGASQILAAPNRETVRAILSILAIARGARGYAGFLINYTEDELEELKQHAKY